MSQLFPSSIGLSDKLRPEHVMRACVMRVTKPASNVPSLWRAVARVCRTRSSHGGEKLIRWPWLDSPLCGRGQQSRARGHRRIHNQREHAIEPWVSCLVKCGATNPYPSDECTCRRCCCVLCKNARPNWEEQSAPWDRWSLQSNRRIQVQRHCPKWQTRPGKAVWCGASSVQENPNVDVYVATKKHELACHFNAADQMLHCLHVMGGCEEWMDSISEKRKARRAKWQAQDSVPGPICMNSVWKTATWTCGSESYGTTNHETSRRECKGLRRARLDNWECNVPRSR